MPPNPVQDRIDAGVRGAWSIAVCSLGVLTADLAVNMLADSGQAVWRQHRAATSFVPVEGVVIANQVETDAPGRCHRAQITYRYDWQGTPYESQRLDFSDTIHGGKDAIGLERAERFIADHPVESKVSAFVDPSAPEVSVLRVGIAGADLLSPLVAVALGGFAALSLVEGAKGWMRRRVDPRAGRFVENADGRITLTMPEPSLWVPAAALIGCIFLSGEELRDQGTLALPSVAAEFWLIIIACAGLCWAIWRQRRAGDPSFTIDRPRGMLMLPRRPLRGDRPEIPLDRIVSVERESKPNFFSKGRSTNFTLAITHDHLSTGRRVKRVMSRSDAEDIDVVCEWLLGELDVARRSIAHPS